MSRAPSIRTGLTSEEIKQDFLENLRCGLPVLYRRPGASDRAVARRTSMDAFIDSQRRANGKIFFGPLDPRLL